MFCYQAAAYRRGEGIDTVITFGSPVDTRVSLPLGIPAEVAEAGAGVLAEVFGRTAVPAWMSRTGFRLLDPVKSLRQQVDFILQLHDREALLPRERQRRFLMGEGWVAWPGPAVADFMRQFIAHNRMLQGGFVIRNRTVTLADISCPVLTVVGEVDEIAPAEGVRAIARASPRAEVYELALRAGHFGLVVGSTATQTTWPTVAAWARWRAGDGELPELIRNVAEDDLPPEAPGVGTRLGLGLELSGGRRRWARPLGRRGRGPHRRWREGADRGDHRPAAPPRAARPSAPRHPGLARPAARRAGQTGAGGRVLPVRGPCLPSRRRQAPDRQRGPRAGLARRPPGRACRGADEDPAERPLGRRGAQPARSRRGADAARRAGRPRGRARPGAADRRRPGAGCGAQPRPGSPR